MVDEQQLVKQAQQGSREALAALYAAYQAPIYRYFCYRIGDSSLADDLTAEVFVAMVKNINHYEDRGRPFLAWLYSIAANTLKMHYRRLPKNEIEPLPNEMIDPDANPVEMTQSRLTQDRLLAAMPHLTEGQRQVILLKFMEGFSTAEIAAILEKNEGAIRILQHRALVALRHILADEVQHERV